MTGTEKSDLSPFASPLSRHTDQNWPKTNENEQKRPRNRLRDRLLEGRWQAFRQGVRSRVMSMKVLCCNRVVVFFASLQKHDPAMCYERGLTRKVGGGLWLNGKVTVLGPKHLLHPLQTTFGSFPIFGPSPRFFGLLV